MCLINSTDSYIYMHNTYIFEHFESARYIIFTDDTFKLIKSFVHPFSV